jgi:hypothetical protein
MDSDMDGEMDVDLRFLACAYAAAFAATGLYLLLLAGWW